MMTRRIYRSLAVGLAIAAALWLATFMTAGCSIVHVNTTETADGAISRDMRAYGLLINTTTGFRADWDQTSATAVRDTITWSRETDATPGENVLIHTIERGFEYAERAGSCPVR